MLSTIWLKITWYQKLQADLGLMQQLLIGVIKAFMPFLVIYLFWVLFFALVSIILENNRSLALSYTGLPYAFEGYFMTTFENSLGNVSAPTIGFFSNSEGEKKFLDELRVFLVYAFWFVM